MVKSELFRSISSLVAKNPKSKIEAEAYLNGTSQEPTPEDARKDGHIIRARCAPLSPASGFPVSWSQSRRGVNS
jgi:hypothetical protein